MRTRYFESGRDGQSVRNLGAGLDTRSRSGRCVGPRVVVSCGSSDHDQFESEPVSIG